MKRDSRPDGLVIFFSTLALALSGLSLGNAIYLRLSAQTDVESAMSVVVGFWFCSPWLTLLASYALAGHALKWRALVAAPLLLYLVAAAVAVY